MKITKKSENIIKKNNEIWKNASNKEKIILLCKDALKQLKSGHYRANRGSWVSERTIKRILENVPENKSIQPLLVDETITCSCCALGALMLSKVRYCNEVRSDKDRIEADLQPISMDIHGQLEDIFDWDQLEMIEYCFEKGHGYCRIYNSNVVENCNKFIETYPENKSRAIAIFQNIIDNNGVFKPWRVYD